MSGRKSSGVMIFVKYVILCFVTIMQSYFYKIGTNSCIIFFDKNRFGKAFRYFFVTKMYEFRDKKSTRLYTKSTLVFL
jgi:hypothetical protein